MHEEVLKCDPSAFSRFANKKVNGEHSDFFKKHFRKVLQKPISDLWMLDIDKSGNAYMLK